ncbi:hypothetical protein N665_1293s0008 [Sinapis alba]|nr:hypothetical protein N665_1293s0008 [Sinapis alba]
MFIALFAFFLFRGICSTSFLSSLFLFVTKWIHIGSCDEWWWIFFCPRHIFSNLFTTLIRVHKKQIDNRTNEREKNLLLLNYSWWIYQKVKEKEEARGERRRDRSGVRRKEH